MLSWYIAAITVVSNGVSLYLQGMFVCTIKLSWRVALISAMFSLESVSGVGRGQVFIATGVT